MKTVWKVILIASAAIVGLLVSLVVVLFFLITSNSARTPDEIANKAGMRLPAYHITKSEDNMDRTTSPWSHYYFEIEFKKPLPDSYLQKLGKKKTCERGGGAYRIADEDPDEWSCLIYLYPAENRATLEFAFWDYLFPVDIE